MNEEEEDPVDGRSVVLLRHGIAEDAAPGQADEERALTTEGHARMKQIAKGLERAFPKAQAIYASPLLRAQQTAIWVSKAYRGRARLLTTEVLVPGASAEAFAELLRMIPERRIVVVGHEPNLSRNTLALIRAGDRTSIDFKKAGAACVRLRGDGDGTLQWMLTPRLLTKLSEE
jgi:phosphohistidine phosphatase